MKKPFYITKTIGILLLLGVLALAGCNTNSEEQREMEEHKSKLVSEVRYAQYFGFHFNVRMSVLLKDVEENPQDYTRVDFYMSQPDDFVEETIVDGVIITFPTEYTQKYIDNLNWRVEQGDIIPEEHGFSGEFTMEDLVDRHSEMIAMIDSLPQRTQNLIYA